MAALQLNAMDQTSRGCIISDHPHCHLAAPSSRLAGAFAAPTGLESSWQTQREERSMLKNHKVLAIRQQLQLEANEGAQDSDGLE